MALGEVLAPPIEAVLSGGVLTVKGPRSATLRLHNGKLSIDGVSIRSGAQYLGSVAAGCVTRIVFNAAPAPEFEGDDEPMFDPPNDRLTLWTGDGADS